MAYTTIPLTLLPVGIRPARRFAQLFLGLGMYRASMSLMLRADLGMSPWGSLQEGLAEKTGLSYGLVTIVIGAVLLLAWIPMRQMPGVGTLANVVVIGVAADATLAVVGAPAPFWVRVLLLLGGVLLNGVSIAVYVGARFGPGPRDGLMTGLSPILHMSLRRTRTLIEIVVLVGGFVLGGTIGAGTVLYAVAVGPMAQALLPHTVIRQAA